MQPPRDSHQTPLSVGQQQSQQYEEPHPANLPLLQEDGDGTVSFPVAILVLGIALVVWGYYFWGMILAVAGFTFAVCHAAMDHIREEDKQDIRYNILEPYDIVQELVSWEAQLKDPRIDNSRKEVLWYRARIHCISGLEGLARKYGKRQNLEAAVAAAAAASSSQQQQDQQQTPGGTTQHPKQPSRMKTDHELEFLCQQAAYIAYRLFFPEKDDQVIAAALSLHALVAKDSKVRQRHLFEADSYGLDLPIQCMKQSLKHARDETNASKEQQCAELQRKACLLLGALGDGDADVATQIVNEDGLEAVLDTMNWYRYHEDVANWALWAVFILSYENLPNQIRTVDLGGIPIIIQTLRNVPDCLEVTRHGVAILFALMRDGNHGAAAQGGQQQKHLDVWTIRKSAMAAGLHEVILLAMANFDDKIDINMMGQEILAGTDYRGKVPQYQPNSSDVAG